MTPEHNEIRIEFNRVEQPDVFEDGDIDLRKETRETAELRFSVDECEQVRREVLDEAERIQSQNQQCDRVVVDVGRYARLLALVAMHTHRHARPSKESVESHLGVSITVVEADDVVEAVAADSEWVASNFAFDDMGEDGAE